MKVERILLIVCLVLNGICLVSPVEPHIALQVIAHASAVIFSFNLIGKI